MRVIESWRDFIFNLFYVQKFIILLKFYFTVVLTSHFFAQQHFRVLVIFSYVWPPKLHILRTSDYMLQFVIG